MKPITSDIELKNGLNALPLAAQRKLGARFVESVLSIADDDRVRRAVAVAKDGSATDEELGAASKNAKAASIDYHTRCGYEGDWKEQAGYFVAKAAAACVMPEERARNVHLAWEAAMACRMARTCLVIVSGEAAAHDESARQYQTFNEFEG
ncbi:MAG: hypothetical protein ACFCUG_15305 [Thiotrichales bacterium]